MSRLADGIENLQFGMVNPTRKVIDPKNMHSESGPGLGKFSESYAGTGAAGQVYMAFWSR